MILCYYEVGAQRDLNYKVEIFTSNFSALENNLNNFPQILGKDYPLTWHYITEDKRSQGFPAVIRISNDGKNAHGQMDINNVVMCELYFSGSSQGQIPDTFEHGNENSVSLKVRNFFTSQSNCTFFNVTQHDVCLLDTTDILGWFYFPLISSFQILMH
jgi:hypothetical protein